VRRSAIVLLGAAVLVLAACQRPAPVPPQASPDIAAQALAALERGDYERAADLYRQALQGAPESLPLHYGLAIAASHLELREEAIREFRWVLERGGEGSPEVVTARGWLARVGALPRPPSATAQEARRDGQASLSGRALFAEGKEAPKPVGQLLLLLVGQPDSPASEARYRLRTEEDGGFRFENVTPGTYMLTNRLAGQPIWRLRVELKGGEGATLDLTPANSVQARDDFPGRG
jgi:tetratricopeptide (TPR) repeat protein